MQIAMPARGVSLIRRERDGKRGMEMTGARRRGERHLAVKIAVLPLIMAMTLIQWVLEAVLVLNNWVIRPVAGLSILSGVVLMFQKQEDWMFILPALGFGIGLLFVAPAAQAILRGLTALKKSLIRVTWGAACVRERNIIC